MAGCDNINPAVLEALEELRKQQEKPRLQPEVTAPSLEEPEPVPQSPQSEEESEVDYTI